MAKKVLLAGESWTSYTTHVKGFDSFVTSIYAEGGKWLTAALEKAGYEVVYLPGQLVAENFPFEMAELKKYSGVIISDIGSNTFLLPNATFAQSVIMPNRLKLIREYVEKGGALLMVGGYLSFQGIDAKARYHDSPIEECLPVIMQPGDDRVETPQGAKPKILKSSHAILKGIPEKWPQFLGYNRFAAKEGAETLISVGTDPFLVVGECGKGRSAAFASDCSPHWAPPKFVNWAYYNAFWGQLMNWLAGK